MGEIRAAVGRTKGLYMYSISPFYQKPFRGWIGELTHSVRSHYKWGLYVGGIAFGAYSLVKWANHDFHQRSLKNSADYENEPIEAAEAS
jgi:hypothetical protein